MEYHLEFPVTSISVVDPLIGDYENPLYLGGGGGGMGKRELLVPPPPFEFMAFKVEVGLGLRW